MRLSNVLFFRRFKQKAFEKMKKLHWRQTGKNMWVRDSKLPLEIENRLQGVEVEDMLTSNRYKEIITREIDFVDDSWTPPVNLEDYVPKAHLQAREAHLYQTASRFAAGEKQSIILTNSNVLHTLPPSHEELIVSMVLPDNAYEVLQDCVMRSNVWANDSDKLPRRHFPNLPIWKPKPEFGIAPKNQARYLLTDLLRYAFIITHQMYADALTARLTLRDMALSTHYMWKDNEIYFTSNHDIAVCGRNALPIIQPKSTNEQFPLPDISPLSPLIDLKLSRDYDTNHRVGMSGSYQHPHLVSVNTADLPMKWNSFAEPEAFYTTQDQKNAIGIMSAFSVALASAHDRFGSEIKGKTLPEPVISQVVCCDGVHFDFVCFQLNTLDFSSNHGPQNQAWVDGGNALFEKRLRNRALLREATFHDLNPEVFKKLLSMYNFGLNAIV